MAIATMGSTIATHAQDDKPTITVGSKNYAEQLIVGEMVALLLENAGFPVERQMNLGGTAIAHEGLVSGDLDVYVEYTGTGLIAILEQELPEAEASPGATAEAGAIVDPAYAIVAEAYPREFGVEWLKPWGFNNTFAIVVRQNYGTEHQISKISDLEPIAGDMTLGSDPEFAVRPDGLPGLEETYGFSFKDVQTMDVGLLYSSIAEGNVDVSVAASTDGRIPAFDLLILDDDKSFFPPYYAAPIVRQDLLEKAPDVETILNQLAGKISNDEMASMNYDVDENDNEPIDVARGFLADLGLIDS